MHLFKLMLIIGEPTYAQWVLLIFSTKVGRIQDAQILRQIFGEPRFGRGNLYFSMMLIVCYFRIIFESKLSLQPLQVAM
jgi:hypothetical protein